ncbi:MAG: hypothetical protein WCX74_00915 [Candidatus Paceibacterota bacterium]
MDEVRKGQIALKVLQERIQREGITLNPGNTKRELGNLSQKTGIPVEELKEFMKEEALRVIEQCLGQS